MMEYRGALPQPTPETQPYWDGAREGRLMLPWCEDCGQPHFHPRAICPHCGAARLQWRQASGRGRERKTCGLARPLADIDQLFNDVAVRDGTATIFARLDRDINRARVIAHDPHGRVGRLARTHCHLATGSRDRRAGLHDIAGNRSVQLTLAAAKHRVTAIDDHLRRCDLRAASEMRIVPLARGVGWAAEHVLPAQIVPVSDRKRQRDHVGAVRQLVDHPVGGRAA